VVPSVESPIDEVDSRLSLNMGGLHRLPEITTLRRFLLLGRDGLRGKGGGLD